MPKTCCAAPCAACNEQKAFGRDKRSRLSASGHRLPFFPFSVEAPTAIPESERLDALREALPDAGLFAGMNWRWSPRPFPLAPATVTRLEKLGGSLHRFLRTANDLYHRSRKGSSLPTWLAAYLDAGKPLDLLDHATSSTLRDQLPRVIRPDLLLTDKGFALSEIDSVPGGIGLTAWLHDSYGRLGENDLVGGAEGMIGGFRSIFPEESARIDISISQESGDYRPEMDWLTQKLRERECDRPDRWRVVDAESHQPAVGSSVYRFFELFDLPNLPAANELLRRVAAEEIDLSAPAKPWLEEKLWLALFWLRPLRDIWRRELRDSHWRTLQELIPYSWIVDPTPLPHHAVLPRLEIQDFAELGDFSQSQRELVLKVSGFSEIAWGSRSVRIGHDLPQDEWKNAVQTAIAGFPEQPWLLQEFSHARRVEHPRWDAQDQLSPMEGRVRLCPYYFVSGSGKSETVKLGGVLATIVPADKKIIHGMSDAIITPCRIDADGY